MKIVSFRQDGMVRYGVLDGESVEDAGTDLTRLEPTGRRWPLDRIVLGPPIPNPGKIICVALNYAAHAGEGGAKVPSEPLIIAKFPNAVVGSGQPILLPSSSNQIDYEAELGVVIGRRGRAIPAEEALDHVLGYTCVNDISARDIQMKDRQWVRAKSFDTFCPMGPWIVTGDEVGDPQKLDIRCCVNDEVRQQASTSDMLFDVATLISCISADITLEPGDVITTGTPGGIGMTMDPPAWLAEGDTVTVSIERIGTLENRVARRVGS